MPIKRVLLIDDEEIVRKCGERSLRPAGYEVDVTGDGSEGLAMQREKPYDLVVTDLKMPKIDGMQITRGVRALSPKTKVIVITGYITPGTRESVLEAGAHACVEKPFTPEDLIRAVADAIGWSED